MQSDSESTRHRIELALSTRARREAQGATLSTVAYPNAMRARAGAGERIRERERSIAAANFRVGPHQICAALKTGRSAFASPSPWSHPQPCGSTHWSFNLVDLFIRHLLGTSWEINASGASAANSPAEDCCPHAHAHHQLPCRLALPVSSLQPAPARRPHKLPRSPAFQQRVTRHQRIPRAQMRSGGRSARGGRACCCCCC